MNTDRPNILFIMTDQQRGDCLGIDGHPVLQTPNLDHVGASGVRFTRAYSACPVCVPARRTVMTGQRPATHGQLMNGWAPLEAPTLPGVLSAAGYQSHLVGKLHFQPQRARHGFWRMTQPKCTIWPATPPALRRSSSGAPGWYASWPADPKNSPTARRC